MRQPLAPPASHSTATGRQNSPKVVSLPIVPCCVVLLPICLAHDPIGDGPNLCVASPHLAVSKKIVRFYLV